MVLLRIQRWLICFFRLDRVSVNLSLWSPSLLSLGNIW
jgi:hypothetical protein